MTSAGFMLAQAAEDLIGTPFRLHGRDRATGVDCVGLVACALMAIGRRPVVPRGYALRHCAIDDHLPLALRSGFVTATGPEQPGDLLLVRPGPAQHHLLIAVGGRRFVHAHAGLGRVVAMPGPPEWPYLAHWRLAAPQTGAN